MCACRLLYAPANGCKRRFFPVAVHPGEGLFSIAASVKLWPDDYMLSPLLRSGCDATRGSRFSSRSVSGRLMMG